MYEGSVLILFVAFSPLGGIQEMSRTALVFVALRRICCHPEKVSTAFTCREFVVEEESCRSAFPVGVPFRRSAGGVCGCVAVCVGAAPDMLVGVQTFAGSPTPATGHCFRHGARWRHRVILRRGRAPVAAVTPSFLRSAGKTPGVFNLAACR